MKKKTKRIALFMVLNFMAVGCQKEMIDPLPIGT